MIRVVIGASRMGAKSDQWASPTNVARRTRPDNAGLGKNPLPIFPHSSQFLERSLPGQYGFLLSLDTWLVVRAPLLGLREHAGALDLFLESSYSAVKGFTFSHDDTRHGFALLSWTDPTREFQLFVDP